MSAAWPAECIPWTTTAPPGSHEGHRTLPATTPSRREGGHTTSTTPATTPNRDRIVARGDEACLNARFTCKVPGCTHRFISARLLGLHLRMGHSDFDLEKMKALENEGGIATLTHDGLPVQSSTCVEGDFRWVGVHSLLRLRQESIILRLCIAVVEQYRGVLRVNTSPAGRVGWSGSFHNLAGRLQSDHELF